MSKHTPPPSHTMAVFDFFQINIHFWVEGGPLFSSFSSLGMLLSKMLLKYICLDMWIAASAEIYNSIKKHICLI